MGNMTKVWRTAHDTTYTVKLRAREWSFHSRSHNQTTSWPPESRNSKRRIKYWAYKCLPPLMWKGGVLQSIPGGFIVWLTPLRHHRPSGPQHEQAQIYPMQWSALHACFKAGMISRLLSIISSPAAGIKPMLVSRSTSQNSGRKKPTNDLTN